ncbi:hypothetical protein B0O80DRAFT_436264, partial [Mortierella sp. GBAus27b]
RFGTLVAQHLPRSRAVKPCKSARRIAMQNWWRRPLQSLELWLESLGSHLHGKCRESDW